MKAYAILDGGGVKGAALAGCLKAAEEQGIKFEGYGGSSAGALIATLAAVGYSADELREILNETGFRLFLDDEGAALARLQSIPQRMSNPVNKLSAEPGQLEEVTLKKKKLQLKDRMESILRRHRQDL